MMKEKVRKENTKSDPTAYSKHGDKISDVIKQAFSMDPMVQWHAAEESAENSGNISRAVSDFVMGSGSNGTDLFFLPNYESVLVGYNFPENKNSDFSSEDIMPLLDPARGPRFPELFAQFEEYKYKYLQEHGPFFYVLFIATMPEHQGKGLGSVILGRVCDEADQSGRHLYLDASSPQNKRMYERLGFTVYHTFEPCEPGAPLTFGMCRPPRKAQ